MNISKNEKSGTPCVSQRPYLEKVMKICFVLYVKAIQLPLGVHFDLSLHDCPNISEEKEYMSWVPYSSVVGSIIFVVVCIWPDFPYVVSVLSRYMSNLGKHH